MNHVATAIYLLEAIAFISSIIYYKRNRGKPFFYFMLFLGSVVFFENIGKYNRYPELFSFINNTPFQKNFWLFNIQLLISMVFYAIFFSLFINNQRSKRIIYSLVILFFSIASIVLFFDDNFFKGFSPFTLIAGSILVLISISIYYFELLKSEQLLSIWKSMVFYISVGAFVYHLCTTPLFLYSIFLKSQANPAFIETYKIVVYVSNLFLYLVYIFGFFTTQNQSLND
ncbi:MAG TPA: hypothetical protein PKW08_08190 [Flavobacteriaceae bacterium]|nr:hypothetical protein [Flavobacteriaceae bacterium]MCB9213509.1 hypothetical protein [Alteromonas sp.]HPF10735.1 hypothetical protein [Flavobacteriaceae bacterium]HQU21557.1 hypothetical protein [Flavobacteriaceae bacterium]HQU65526.1 hypothetical protein [Flavobacteriaceae bacterium]